MDRSRRQEIGKAAAKAAAGFALAGLFAWLAFRSVSAGAFFRTIRSAEVLPVLGAAAFQTASYLVRAWRWRLLLSESPNRPAVRHAFAALMVGQAVNTAVPRGGEVVRAFYLRRVSGTSASAALGSVFVERLLDLTALVLLVPISLWLYEERFARLAPGLGGIAWGILAITALGMVLVWAAGRRAGRLLRRLQGLARCLWPTREERIVRAGGNFLRGLGGLFRRKNAFLLAFTSVLIWTLYTLAHWTLFSALPFGGRLGMGLRAGVLINTVTAFAFALPSPGGAGTTHYFVGRTLTEVFGVPGAKALVYATLFHGMTTALSLALGGLCFAALPRGRRGRGAG